MATVELKNVNKCFGPVEVIPDSAGPNADRVFYLVESFPYPVEKLPGGDGSNPYCGDSTGGGEKAGPKFPGEFPAQAAGGVPGLVEAANRALGVGDDPHGEDRGFIRHGRHPPIF